MKELLGSLELNRIYQFDCTEGMRLLPDNCIDLIVTSPPYIDMKDYGHKEGTIAPEDYVKWFKPKAKEMFRILNNKGSFVLNVNDKPENRLRNPWIYRTVNMLLDEGFLLYDTIIWDKMKSFIMPDKSRLSDCFEYLFWFVKSRDYEISFPEEVKVPVSEGTLKRRKYSCHGKDMSNLPTTKIPSTILQFSSLTKFKEHKAAYPEELPKFFIHTCTKENEIVLDPFMGSGTTAVVSTKLNRNFLGFELNPTYIETANKRLDDLETQK